MEKYKNITIIFAAVLFLIFAVSAHATAPRVVKCVPENGDQNVDAGLRQIRIEFDQDMDRQSYSICGGGPNYPETIGKPKWISKKTIVMRVKLQPNHKYELSVNSPSYKNFRNVLGELAIIHPIKFKTGVAKSKTTSSKSPGTLLQEGLYAEQTEGDLDKAIEIYQQVIEELKPSQRIAAKATYQLGMCYLKKGDEAKAAGYFGDVVANYPKQSVLVKKSQAQLKKIRPVDDIIAKSYVIHYKAIDQSKNALELLNKNHPRGVRTHHANRYRKNGETIDSICTDNEAGKDKIVEAINDSDELELVKVESPESEAIMTQEMHNTIDANGLIHFKSPNRITNNNSEPMTTTVFINSDFVMLTKMYEENETAIPFETTHEGSIYRYRITFNKPIMPGESMVYYTEGTTRGLIRPVPDSKDVFRYFMVHSPMAGQPVLRIETYLLPEDAVFISTSTPDIQKTEKDGRIELSVEKVVPANGSIATEFQYRLSASIETLKLEPAPWVDGEVMEVRLKRPAGDEYGTIIYSAQSNVLNANETWQIISHMYVREGSVSQYTFVEAEAESFAPIYGQTKNWMGNFIAEYEQGKVHLETDVGGKKSTREVPVAGIKYDNEQALYFIRRMPLAEDYEGSFPIFTIQGGTSVECRIKVLGVEEVTVEAGTFSCYKTDLSIYLAGMRTLQHTLWFSADEHKYLVKYDVGGAATMELAKVWQKDKDKPLTFESEESNFSVTIPTDWRFYSYESAGPQYSHQLIPPEVKAWGVLVWQKRGTDADSASAITIAKADSENLKGLFENYSVDVTSWKEYKINGLEAAQYFATYQEKGSPLRKYTKPKEMVEYRTYIVDESNVYWFVFRIEEDKFGEDKSEFDSIVNSFKIDEK